METYGKNIFTTGPVGFPGVAHIDGPDFSAVINKALELPGFQEDVEGKTVLVGFGRNAVLSVAGKVIQSVKDGHIKRFILVGGCDGAKGSRSYYPELVEKAPKDTIILTLACEIPLLTKTSEQSTISHGYSTSVNATTRSAVKSQWRSQMLSKSAQTICRLIVLVVRAEAVAILLSLPYGVKDIRIGPSLPAFITPGILNVLAEKFNIIDQDGRRRPQGNNAQKSPFGLYLYVFNRTKVDFQLVLTVLVAKPCFCQASP